MIITNGYNNDMHEPTNYEAIWANQMTKWPNDETTKQQNERSKMINAEKQTKQAKRTKHMHEGKDETISPQ